MLKSPTPFLQPAGEQERGLYAAPALAKGLDILELLAAEGESLSTRAIADRLGRSKNEIFRMVFVLVERGYIAREPGTDLLSLTNRLFALGIRTPRARTLVEIAVPAMETLSALCSQSVHLVVLSRGETVVIATANGAADVSFTLRLGYRRPALDATSGRIILAFQPDDTRARLIEEARMHAGIVNSDEHLDLELETIRRQGYLMATSHDVIGITDIGCPILKGDGRAVASMVVPYLNRHGTQARHSEVCDLLVQTCRDISGRLT